MNKRIQEERLLNRAIGKSRNSRVREFGIPPFVLRHNKAKLKWKNMKYSLLPQIDWAVSYVIKPFHQYQWKLYRRIPYTSNKKTSTESFLTIYTLHNQLPSLYIFAIRVYLHSILNFQKVSNAFAWPKKENRCVRTKLKSKMVNCQWGGKIDLFTFKNIIYYYSWQHWKIHVYITYALKCT